MLKCALKQKKTFLGLVQDEAVWKESFRQLSFSTYMSVRLLPLASYAIVGSLKMQQFFAIFMTEILCLAIKGV
jgi:hypothetical protein